MNNSSTPNFIITIRAAGERTEQLCYDTVLNQARGADIFIIRENPFKKALEDCFQKGIDSSKKWLITVDADMILLPGAIDLLLKEAEKMPGNYLQLQGRIIDKITGNERKAGPRIYRTSFLPDLLSVSKSYNDHIRPESRLITAYGEKGHPSRYISQVICFHDFEQYYKDIYRKTYVHAYKHSDFLPSMIKKAAAKQHTDNDYKIMLKAIWDGLNEKEKVAIDTRLYEEKSKKVLTFLKLQEKVDLLEELSVEELFSHSDFLIPTLLDSKQPIRFHDQPKQADISVTKIRELIKRIGLMNGIMQGIGTVLIKAGKKLHENVKG